MVTQLQLSTRVYGVVTAPDSVDKAVASTYPAVANMMQVSPSTAVENFQDGEIDLLFVGGVALSESAGDLWKAWRPKVRSGGVVMFHRVGKRNDDDNLWRFWSSVKAECQHFEFLHGDGLGVLLLGDTLSALEWAFEQETLLAARVYFSRLGGLWRQITVTQTLARAFEEKLDAVQAELQSQAMDHKRRLADFDLRLADATAALSKANATNARQAQQVTHWQTTVDQLQRSLAALEEKLAAEQLELRRAHEKIVLRETRITALTDEKAVLLSSVAKLEAELAGAEQTAEYQEAFISQYKLIDEQHRDALSQRAEELTDQRTLTRQLEDHIGMLVMLVQDRTSQLDLLRESLKEAQAGHALQKSFIKARTDELDGLHDRLTLLEASNRASQEMLQLRETDIAAHQATIEHLRGRLAAQQRNAAEVAANVSAPSEAAVALEEQAERLREALRDAENERNQTARQLQVYQQERNEIEWQRRRQAGRDALGRANAAFVERSRYLRAVMRLYTRVLRIWLTLQHRRGKLNVPKLFDAAWYQAQYPEVATSGIPPYVHYLVYGWRYGCKPHVLFDVTWYLANNPDVAEAGVEPLTHYLNYGWHQGRNPSAVFDIEWYLADNPDVAEAGVEPLTHYAGQGFRENRNTASPESLAFLTAPNSVVPPPPPALREL
ncbi:MAG: class I SAM-dependent methyltransferase, partial [Chloroflexota bacterium]